VLLLADSADSAAFLFFPASPRYFLCVWVVIEHYRADTLRQILLSVREAFVLTRISTLLYYLSVVTKLTYLDHRVDMLFDARKLKGLRLALMLSQKTVAKKAGVGLTMFSLFERSHVDIKNIMVKNVLRVYEAELSVVTTLIENPVQRLSKQEEYYSELPKEWVDWAKQTLESCKQRTS